MKKRARLDAIRRRRVEVRTFAGYIGLSDDRPAVTRNVYGNRIVEGVLERAAREEAIRSGLHGDGHGPVALTMTRERIAEGLSVIVLGLANAGFIRDPEDWTPEEWAYLKGLAAGELLRLRDRIVPRATVSDIPGQSQT